MSRKQHLLTRPAACSKRPCSVILPVPALPPRSSLYSYLFQNCHIPILLFISQRLSFFKRCQLSTRIDNVLQEDQGGAAGWWKRPAEAWGPGQRLLACGAQVIAELRAAVREELGYSCSAGAPLSALAWNSGGLAASNLAGAQVARHLASGAKSACSRKKCGPGLRQLIRQIFSKAFRALALPW